ncbi:DUF3850 domain-containing protein [Bradyrhizobium japonicum]|uniref:DUF3850 domain-containing protein n=1 Tax=Bradyrhizobium japonicum TaxID=375 RepID=UPI001E28E3D4|nr:DUF3850 domain-containing protein [Bradyrhizobium japonicum]MCD9816654.1 DUF3850 domain-containing protein [Bradyrhizobium japonicum]MEB2670315.1 DUF3850 domain-containing protein [Bradyrhizobium japonicum]WRI89666.1 DUF3850 domain-containing protein [Bradyrhizobium japonicum]
MPITASNTTHHLKCWPQFFNEIAAGRKKHDLRRADDRRFRVGDILVLEEYDPQKEVFTGRVLEVEVTYITSADLPCALSKDALHPSFCILSISPIAH